MKLIRNLLLLLVLAGLTGSSLVVGQGVWNGGIVSAGTMGQVVGGGGGGGGPFTYLAQTTQCELGTELNCPSGQPLKFLGCNYWTNTYVQGGAPWSSSTTYASGVIAGYGGTNVYLSLVSSNLNNEPDISPTQWKNLGACGTPPNIGGLLGANTIISSPDFNTNYLRVTDYATHSTACSGISYQNGASSSFSWWSVNSGAFVVNPVSGNPCVFAFYYGSANCLAAISVAQSMCVLPSDIGGSGSVSCTTGCTAFGSGTAAIAMNQTPYAYFEVDPSGPAIYKDVITNPTSSPSSWVFSRTKLFNWLTDCSGPCALPSGYSPSWNGVIAAADNDQSLTFASSDNGQSTPGPQYSDGSRGCPQPAGTTVTKYGPSFVLSWTAGFGPGGTAGWRVYNTCGFLFENSDLPYITGNYGDTGVPTDGTTCTSTSGTCNPGTNTPQPLGTSGGCSIPDKYWLHDASGLSDFHYTTTGPNTHGSGAAGSCNATISNCTYTGGNVCSDSSMYWEIATTNVRASLTQGHNIKGYIWQFIGKSYKSNAYHWPQNTTPPNGQNLIAQQHIVDDHGCYNNDGTLDQQPICAATVQSGSNGGPLIGVPGSAPTIPVGGGDGYYPFYGATYQCNAALPSPVACAWWNEMIMSENTVGNAGNPANSYGQHCFYYLGSPPVLTQAPCVYRFGAAYNTGLIWQFGTSQNIVNNSPDGRFALIASDWQNELGCTNGWDGVSAGQLCLDPISGGNNATSAAITNVSVDGAGTTATITATNVLPLISTGMLLNLGGLTGATFLNTGNYFVTSFTNSSFTICSVANGAGSLGTGTAPCTVGGIGHSTYGSHPDSGGSAVWGGCGSTLQQEACQRGDLFIMDLTSAH